MGHLLCMQIILAVLLIFGWSVHGGLMHGLDEVNPAFRGSARISNSLLFPDNHANIPISESAPQKRWEENHEHRSHAKAKIRELVAELTQLENALDSYQAGSSSLFRAMTSLLQTIEVAVSGLQSQPGNTAFPLPISFPTEIPTPPIPGTRKHRATRPGHRAHPHQKTIAVVSISTATTTLLETKTTTTTSATTITTTLSVTTTLRPKGHRITHSGNTKVKTIEPTSSIPAATAGTFDPLASNNIAVYYGQTPLTGSRNLLDLCVDPAITIINLAFVSDFFGPGGYPKASFGPACGEPQTSQQKSVAPGLPNCSQLGEQISTCQAVYGKKIFVSLGGYIASSSFPTLQSAHTFANRLWNLFGPGTEEVSLLRPFGPDVVVDGFDIDNEDHATTYWIDFARTLRQLYASPEAISSGKSYYLSSTPQCLIPDASVPTDVMALSDFVNVQFYNNPSCNFNSGQGFLSSVQAWSQSLAQLSSPLPKLLLGVPAWPGAGSGYVSGQAVRSVITRAKAAIQEYGNFGGVAMWDGLEGLANVDPADTNFIEYVAEALY